MSTKNFLVERRLLPGHEFRVMCFNDDGMRFVKSFRSTWRRLPLIARRAILVYWRKKVEGRPKIELSNLWVSRGSSGQSFAEVACLGREMRFRQDVFVYLPQQVAHWVIAHELAHVYQWASGETPCNNQYAHELDADDIVRKWGFSRESFSFLVMMRQNRGLSVADACREIEKLVNYE
jgi:hypothetical protein